MCNIRILKFKNNNEKLKQIFRVWLIWCLLPTPHEHPTTHNNQASTHLESNAPITSDLAVVAVEGSGVQATYTSSLGQTLRKGMMAVSIALAGVPSASTITTVGSAGVLAATTMSCEKDDPSAINRSTDNPAHKADFMKDVSAVEIKGANWKIWSFSFNAVWSWKNYKLSTICVLNAEGCAEQLRNDAKLLWKESEQMWMEFYYRNSWGNISIVWSIPYSEFINNSWEINLKDDKYDKYLQNNTVWSSKDLIPKNDSWWLRISTWYKFIHSSWLTTFTVSSRLLNLIPYSFWWSN